MFIDTHAHLNFPDFKDDWPQVFSRAKRVGVAAIINVASDLVNAEKAVNIARQVSEGLYAAVGFHPLYTADVKDTDLEIVSLLAQDKKVVAIGETGLDYFENPDRSQQTKVFEELIGLAIQLQKPVIVHCRESEYEVLTILQKYPKLPGVLHCFPGDWVLAQKVLALGFLISFTGSITYNLSHKTREVIEQVPLGKIILETDCPFMTPLKYRASGERVRNEPAYVVEVGQKIAEIKKIPLEQVAKQTTKNARELFKI